jgi:integrase
MKLNPAIIEALELPAGVRDRTWFDETLPGFGLRLRDTGQRRWIVQYDIGGKTRRMTLGSTSLLGLTAARETAKDILAAVRLGKDPAAEKQQTRERAAETFGVLLPRYLRQVSRRPRSLVELERHLLKHAKPLHHHPLATLDRRVIGTLITRLAENNGRTVAKFTRADIIKYLGWAMKEGLLDTNPAVLTNMPTVADPRTRVLSLSEIQEILAALPDNDYGDIVRLLIYLAARRTEIGDLQWDEINFEAAEIRLPPERCKNGKAHVIPLTAAPLALLRERARKADRPRVFGRGGRGNGYQGWAFDKRQLDERIAAARKKADVLEPMPAWVVHDIRRSFSTHCHDTLGQQPHIIEACLGHFQSGIAAVYNRAQYLRERRDVLERWAAYIEDRSTAKVLKVAAE